MTKHDKPTIFVTRRWPAEAEAALSKHFSPTFNVADTPLSAAEMAAGFASHDAIAPTVSDKIGSDIISAGAKGAGRLIANFGVAAELRRLISSPFSPCGEDLRILPTFPAFPALQAPLRGHH